ncbi:B3/4 domain-containing protein [Caenimonas terrae]|uniref:B3/4 domain-containing protein n=1 Tax=Caenimonas terrae TaxID=696074 RepID=A0ABW0NII8_9BURK
MHFDHAPAIWSQYPELTAGVLFVEGIHAQASVDGAVAQFNAIAQARLEGVLSEGELPEIQAWRRAFQRMGLKPTQYRCASESLLRRFRKEGALPSIHPLIDLCNAASIAFAVPVAVLDASKVAWPLQVRHAGGTETYLAFSGETEHPEPGEVGFVDAQGNAHARRWTHRQSGLSAVREDTACVLIVAEAMHAGAAADVRKLLDALAQAIGQAWGVAPRVALLTAQAPRFALQP